ncbi:MAG: hypothetical protein DRJ03_16980 [Chloroflexi bacterium]|nr:MAG: hypothetical protein DRJ03_16980 [Chloroflexota bacterium]
MKSLAGKIFSVFAGLTGLALLYDGLWELSEAKEREVIYRKALRYARSRKKPLLVVGNPKGRHGKGDVCIDINPEPGCLKADVHNLSMFPDKYFGAAFVSHVLEHIENPRGALDELTRVADRVYILTPSPFKLNSWLHPGHKWIIFDLNRMKRIR